MKTKPDFHARFFSLLEQRRYVDTEAIISKDCILNFPGHKDYSGIRNIIRIFSLMGSRFSEIKWHIDETYFSKPDCFFCLWRVQGLFSDGQPYNNSGISFIRIDKESKISYLSDYFKSTEFLNTKRRDGL